MLRLPLHEVNALLVYYAEAIAARGNEKSHLAHVYCGEEEISARLVELCAMRNSFYTAPKPAAGETP